MIKTTLHMVFTVPLASPFPLSALPFSRDLCCLRMEFGAVRGAAVIIPLAESLIAGEVKYFVELHSCLAFLLGIPVLLCTHGSFLLPESVF